LTGRNFVRGVSQTVKGSAAKEKNVAVGYSNEWGGECTKENQGGGKTFSGGRSGNKHYVQSAARKWGYGY